MQTVPIIPTVTTGTVKLFFGVLQYKKLVACLIGSYKIRKHRNTKALFDHLTYPSDKMFAVYHCSPKIHLD